MNYEKNEEELIKLSDDNLVEWLMANGFIRNEYCCDGCSTYMNLEDCASFSEKKCWRCINSNCSKYRQRINVRKDSFLNHLKLILRLFLKF